MSNDFVPITPGSGRDIAVNTIGGLDYQRIKVTWGVDGVAGDAATTNPLPVQLRSPTGVDLSTGLPVTGTFWQVTQPVSAVSLPLPSGAATSAKQDSLLTAIGTPFQVGGSIGNTAFGAVQSGAWSVGVSGTVSLSGTSAISGTVSISGTSVVSGTVAITGTVPVSGTVTATIAANQSVNVAQINGVTTTTGNGVSGTGVQRITLASDSTGQVALAAGTAIIGQTYGAATTVSTSVQRPNDTTAYTANDAWSSSTSAPAAITFSNCVRASGKSSLLTDMVVIDSANQTTLLQGELWLFDTAPAAINDNAAFTVTDGEYATLVAKIPFSIDSAGNVTSGAGGNAGCFVTGINALVTGVGSANLTGLIKVINAYTPVAQETLTFRLKFVEVD